MKVKSQEAALHQLGILAQSKRQSVLIEGPAGCGKTYLAKQYANMIEAADCNMISPKVAEIKGAIESCYTNEGSMLLCIENLDLGVAGASYAMLKFLEEPLPDIYIVITCRNMKHVPDTIISRSACITVGPPTVADLVQYAQSRDFGKYQVLSQRLVWKCVNSFTDADVALGLNITQIDYYEKLSEVCKFDDNISSIVWRISHYPDNSECNLELSIRSIMELMRSRHITECGISCIRDLNQGRIAKHAILAKFAFYAKYYQP